MGRIVQAGDSLYLTPTERRSIRVTQWRFLRIVQGGLEVGLDYDVFFIRNITMGAFHRINHTNTSARKLYEYGRSTLMCGVCGGTGKVDWVSKAAKPPTTGDGALWGNKRYIRNKGPITILTNHLGNNMYVSRQLIRKGEGVCNECRGCGILHPQYREDRDHFIANC